MATTRDCAYVFIMARELISGFKISKIAIVAASLYLLIAVAVFVAHLYSVKTNAGDSGESAIPLFMLSLPWIMLMSTFWQSGIWAWLAYPVLWLCIGFNAVLIYAGVSFVVFILQWLGKILHRVRNNLPRNR